MQPLLTCSSILKVRDFPQLTFTLNGGVTTLEQANEFLAAGIHGVMIGREATNNPWLFSNADVRAFGVCGSHVHLILMRACFSFCIFIVF